MTIPNFNNTAQFHWGSQGVVNVTLGKDEIANFSEFEDDYGGEEHDNALLECLKGLKDNEQCLFIYDTECVDMLSVVVEDVDSLMLMSSQPIEDPDGEEELLAVFRKEDVLDVWISALSGEDDEDEEWGDEDEEE